MKLWKKCLAAGMTAAMVLALGACGGDNGQDEGQSQASGSDKTITVGSSNFTEAIILGEVYSQLIEAKTDYTVEQKFGLAGAAVCFDALENGEIDMFVEYTSTAQMNLLAQPWPQTRMRSGRPSMTLWRRTTASPPPILWASTTPM